MKKSKTTPSVLVAVWAVSCAVTLAGCTREKDRLDEEVRRLCTMDGGIKVYEQVKLPPSKFDEFGVVNVPLKDAAEPSGEFFYEWNITYYKKGNPEMWRNEFKLFRRGDGKLLGKAISYSRRGGDLPIPLPMHESSFGCPSDGDISFLKKRVFVQAAQRRKS